MISYDSNIEQVLAILREEALKLSQKEDQLIGELQVLGVQAMTSADITVRVIGECSPNRADGVARRMKADFKAALEQAGVSFPSPKIVRA